MSLHIRLSDTELFLAHHPVPADGSAPFRFVHHRLRPQASLAANLREALQQLGGEVSSAAPVEVMASVPVTPVPLAEFQEEEAEAVWKYCFTHRGDERVFYDTAPAIDAVLLYALAGSTCRTLHEVLGRPVRYTAALTPVVQHFAAKALGVTSGRRFFISLHDAQADLMVFEESRLLFLNTYAVGAASDVAYYVFNLATQLSEPVPSVPIFVAGQPAWRDEVAHELQQFAGHVYTVNPAAEYNRHPISTTAHMPYDLMCALLQKSHP